MSDKLSKTAPGYLVWNPAGRMPTRPHSDLLGAQNEAHRLADAHPGETFYVMAPVAFVETPILMVAHPQPKRSGTITQIPVVDLDDEIPF